MIQTNRLQDDMIAREQLKISRKKDLYEQRRLRILNAKVRLIGLDVQTLNEQVAEKERLRQVAMDEDKFARAQAMEIERILAASMEEEKAMRQFQMNQMKDSWEDAKHQKYLDSLKPKPVDFDLQNAGPAAALRFMGEDPERLRRLAEQKQQMQRWIQEQIIEKQQLKHLLKEEDMSYAEMIKAIDEIRAQTEKEEKEMRLYIQDTVKQYNKELALQQRERNRTLNRAVGGDDGKGAVNTSLDVFDEDKTLAVNEQGRIIRVDMFRGFTEEQRKRILLDNQVLIQAKNARVAAEKPG